MGNCCQASFYCFNYKKYWSRILLRRLFYYDISSFFIKEKKIESKYVFEGWRFPWTVSLKYIYLVFIIGFESKMISEYSKEK